MANLETTYLGIKIKNPIVVASSGLTSTLNHIIQVEKANASAAVIKSLFEEQINNSAEHLLETSDLSYPEAMSYIKEYSIDYLISNYLTLISDAKNAVKIPIIASINCASSGAWIDFAKKIQEAGADAIELNINILPLDINQPSSHYEDIYIDILKTIKKNITIPVSLKITSSITNLVHFSHQLAKNGVDGIVLFNWFYKPDIDISNMSFISAEVFSNNTDYTNSLRWIGIISSKVKNIDLIASTGVHTGESAIKMILAGAQAVQICSTIYQNGMEQIKRMTDDIEKWMDEKQFKSLADFRGKMNYDNISNAAEYERMQFIKYFSLRKQE